MDEDKQIMLPLIRIEGKTWILLKDLSRAFHFRAQSISKPEPAKDPSDHRLVQSRAEGSVKCTSTREWDISSYVPKKKKE